MVDRTAQSIFADIQAKAFRKGLQQGSKEASEWFFNNVRRRAKGVSEANVLNDSLLKKQSKPLIGRMYFFRYDPKHKDTLPYYDEFPLIFMVGPAKGGFHGINLHYLPPKLRMELFAELMALGNKKGLDEKTKLKLSYGILSGVARFKAFEPCFKHYLGKHVQSNFTEVYASEWEIAALLPVQRFKKATAKKVWNESRKRAV